MNIDSINSQPIDPLATSSQSKEVINFSGVSGQRTTMEGVITGVNAAGIVYFHGSDGNDYFLGVPSSLGLYDLIGQTVQISFVDVAPTAGDFVGKVAQIKVGF